MWHYSTCGTSQVSDWSIQVTWPLYRPLIGQDLSRDLNTDLWLTQTLTTCLQCRFFSQLILIWKTSWTKRIRNFRLEMQQPGGECTPNFKVFFSSVKSSRSSQSILHQTDRALTPRPAIKHDFQFSGLLRKAAKALFLNDEFTEADHVTLILTCDWT